MIDAFKYTATELYKSLQTSEHGLTRTDAGVRLTKYGRNELPEKKPDTYTKIFIRQFKSPLIYILLAAALFVLFFGEYVDTLVIMAVLVINAVIGTFQEGKAQNTLRALKRFATTETVVLRDGHEFVVHDTVLVPGDIVLLKEGDKVPADGRVVSLVNLAVDESALTGESEQVHKVVDNINAEELATADQKNMVFKGTYVTKGSATMLVTATGTHTIVGQISVELAEIQTDVPLKAQIDKLSRIIIRIMGGIAVLILVLGLVRGMSIAEVVSTIVGVAVSVIPEGLPVVVTLILAIGVARMSKKNALVKNLQSVEALGQADVIAVDKTGTLTLNQMMVTKLYLPGELFVVGGSGYTPEGTVMPIQGERETYEALLEEVGRLTTLVSSATVEFSEELQIWDRVSGDPTEAALGVLGRKLTSDLETLRAEYRTVLEVPFESETKYVARVVSHTDHGQTLYMAGAPETILGYSTSLIDSNKKKRFAKKDEALISSVIEQMTSEGLRVVALARRDMSAREVFDPKAIASLTFIGLVGISDSIRSDVPSTIAQAQNAGIRVVMITGDHANTAAAIGRQVGIMPEGAVAITGDEFIALSPEEQASLIPTIGVFARVSPQHKLAIVEAYQRAGMIISMTGDGVNDALSLAAADLGVAMGKRGTEVAKESADIVLVDDRFGSMVDAIEEGRSIYRTIQKVILYLFSTNFGEVLFILIVLIVGLPLTLTATQIIWLNFVTEGFLVVALAFEEKEGTLLTHQAKKESKSIVNPKLMIRLVGMGIAMVIGTMIVYAFYRNDIPKAGTMIVTTLAVFQWFNVFNVRTEKFSLKRFTFGKNPFLGWSLLIVIGLQVLAVYWGPLQRFLKIGPLTLRDWGISILISCSIFIIDWLVCTVISRRKNRS